MKQNKHISICSKQGCRIFFASASSSSWSVMLPSSLPHSWDFLLLALDKVGRFRFQLILSKHFRFLQNVTTSSFRFLHFLSNCMLTAQHKTENLVCRKSVKFTGWTDTIKWDNFNQVWKLFIVTFSIVAQF